MDARAVEGKHPHNFMPSNMQYEHVPMPMEENPHGYYEGLGGLMHMDMHPQGHYIMPE